MKTILTFALCLVAILGHSANPSTKSFRATGGLVVTSNNVTGIITYDGSGISSSTGGVSVVTTNLVWVSPMGDDATALRCRLDLPAKTLTIAKSIATAGQDTVMVLPGNYEGTNLWKNGVNWHFFNGVMVTNISANPGGIFDNTELGTQGAITSNITGDAIFGVIHSNTTATNENGVISLVDSNCMVYVHCKAIYGGPDLTSFYALCLRDGFSTTIECDEINSVHMGAGINSSVLWNQGEASLTCNTIISDNGYGIWGAGFKPGNFHVSCKLIYSTNYAFVFWEPTHKDNKLWLRVNEAVGTEGGVTLGALTQLGGKVYVEAQKISTRIGGTPKPVIYLANTASDSHLWLSAQKVTTTNNAHWFTQTGGTADLTVQEWADDGNIGNTRPASWQVSGGTNYVHGGRFMPRWGPMCKSSGGMSVFRDCVIDTSFVNQNTNYPIWLAGGYVTCRDVTLIAPASAFSIGATAATNVWLETVRMNNDITNNVTVLVGPWTVDSNVR